MFLLRHHGPLHVVYNCSLTSTPSFSSYRQWITICQDSSKSLDDLFIYLGFYVAFNTVQVISRRVVGRAEETSTYSSLGFCTENCQPTASNYQLSHLRPCWEPNPGLRGGGRECYHSATVAPKSLDENLLKLQRSHIWSPFDKYQQTPQLTPI